MIRALAIMIGILAVSAIAHASTKRIAVVVGTNAGNDDRSPLHFAELDASKFARVLGELGGVEPDDLFVLQGKPLAALSQTFALVKQRITGFRREPDTRVIMIFYFSGHSDGEALEFGRDRLTFAELRHWLATLGSDVRIVLVDSCKSGALLEAKGGRPGPGFQIRMTDELASTGEALLTSSAADEVALESREISGSFFTHHLISGLRGAADTSGDGKVTLAEAYQYAYAHTVKTTGETTIGTQHPRYDYRLSGQGELILSELGRRTATLELPGGFERILVTELARDQVMAEVTSDTHVRIAVQPGRYAIHASRDGQLFAAQVAVADDTPRIVAKDELLPSPVAVTTRKSAVPSASSDQLLVATGGSTGVANGLGIVPGMRVELVLSSELSFALDAGSRAGTGFRETSMGVFAGLRRGVWHGAWSAWGGLEVGGGAVLQSELHPLAYSAVVAAAGLAGIAYGLAPRISVAAETTLPVELMKRDGHAALLVVPAAWLGIIVQL
jgi:caspase domain-containing protein